MNIIDRTFQVAFTVSAMAFVATGSLLTYAADPISLKFAPHADGLMMIWVGYSICLLPVMLELQARVANKPAVLVKG